MSQLGTFLENEMQRQGLTANELAAQMGINRTLISNYVNDRRVSCNVETLMRMVRGIGHEEELQAALLEAYFRDQCIEKYKPWVKVDPEAQWSSIIREEPPDSGARRGSGYDSEVASLARLLRQLQLPTKIIEAFADMARYMPGKHKFRVVIEDLGKFAKEELEREDPLQPKPLNRVPHKP